MTATNELKKCDLATANEKQSPECSLEISLEDWSEIVDDPRILEWKYCFTPEERIMMSQEFLRQKNTRSQNNE